MEYQMERNNRPRANVEQTKWENYCSWLVDQSPRAATDQVATYLSECESHHMRRTTALRGMVVS